ncbi:MAG: hypothetical protein JXR76_17180 [Deltaproteobacteria bacterium]|nr:hypothetical protein [Deltaproteobacteria bacterium]
MKNHHEYDKDRGNERDSERRSSSDNLKITDTDNFTEENGNCSNTASAEQLQSETEFRPSAAPISSRALESAKRTMIGIAVPTLPQSESVPTQPTETARVSDDKPSSTTSPTEPKFARAFAEHRTTPQWRAYSARASQTEGPSPLGAETEQQLKDFFKIGQDKNAPPLTPPHPHRRILTNADVEAFDFGNSLLTEDALKSMTLSGGNGNKRREYSTTQSFAKKDIIQIDPPADEPEPEIHASGFDEESTSSCTYTDVTIDTDEEPTFVPREDMEMPDALDAFGEDISDVQTVVSRYTESDVTMEKIESEQSGRDAEPTEKVPIPEQISQSDDRAVADDEKHTFDGVGQSELAGAETSSNATGNAQSDDGDFNASAQLSSPDEPDENGQIDTPSAGDCDDESNIAVVESRDSGDVDANSDAGESDESVDSGDVDDSSDIGESNDASDSGDANDSSDVGETNDVSHSGIKANGNTGDADETENETFEEQKSAVAIDGSRDSDVVWTDTRPTIPSTRAKTRSDHKPAAKPESAKNDADTAISAFPLTGKVAGFLLAAAVLAGIGFLMVRSLANTPDNKENEINVTSNVVVAKNSATQNKAESKAPTPEGASMVPVSNQMVDASATVPKTEQQHTVRMETAPAAPAATENLSISKQTDNPGMAAAMENATPEASADSDSQQRVADDEPLLQPMDSTDNMVIFPARFNEGTAVFSFLDTEEEKAWVRDVRARAAGKKILVTGLVTRDEKDSRMGFIAISRAWAVQKYLQRRGLSPDIIEAQRGNLRIRKNLPSERTEVVQLSFRDSLKESE